MTRTEKTMLLLITAGLFFAIFAILKMADQIDGIDKQQPATCEVWLHSKPLETHHWKGELR